MRAATAATCVRGSLFARHCSRCLRRVMTAPTGQAWLRKHPATKILCSLCYFERSPEDGGKTTLAASLDAMVAELRTMEPNVWPKRN